MKTTKDLIKKLDNLNWQELDYLEQEIRRIKVNAKGGRIYSSNGDATHRAESAQALTEFFEDSFHKHHPGY